MIHSRLHDREIETAHLSGAVVTQQQHRTVTAVFGALSFISQTAKISHQNLLIKMVEQFTPHARFERIAING